MAKLSASLAFPLGGDPSSPFIVNLEPVSDDLEVSIADSISFSIRDVETFVVASQLQVSVGYAHAKASGTGPYAEEIAGLKASSVLAGPVSEEYITVVETASGLELTKTLVGLQRSVYYIGAPLVDGDLGVCATAEIRPDVISVGAQGAVFGVEHGFHNTAAYMFFTNPAGTPSIRIVGPEDSTGTRVPDIEFVYDWTGSVRRYYILWNEIEGQVEFYVSLDGVTQLLYAALIANFQSFDSIPGTPTPSRGISANATMLWGIEGPVGDQVTFKNVALATDVGFPIIGVSRPGSFATVRRSDELVRFADSGDPRQFVVSPWFGPDNLFILNPDPSGVTTLLRTGEFRLTKKTHGTTFALYREEPGLLSSGSNGMMMEVAFYATPGDIENVRAIGMGFLMYDGQTGWQFNLFEGTVRSVGLLKTGGSVANASAHVLATTHVDWLAPTVLRFTVDPRRGLIEIFNMAVSHTTPIMSTIFDRGLFPNAAEMGLSGSPAFIALGHLNNTDTTGSLVLDDVKYSTYYQGYEARDLELPEFANPAWNRVAEGFNNISPLYGIHLFGGGYGPTPLGYYAAGTSSDIGTQAFDANQLVLTNPPGVLQIFKRGADWDSERGMVLEARLQITKFKPQSRSGLFLILDDGLRSYMLSFVDTPVGKFATVPVRAGLNSFIEKAGSTGARAKLSFKIDWDQPHTYRMEFRRLDGLYIFVDNDPEPSLVIPTSDNVDFPTSQFAAPTVAWGQVSKEGSISRWDFVRTSFSRGYEVAFKKTKSDVVLEDDIGNAQAIILAYARDDD